MELRELLLQKMILFPPRPNINSVWQQLPSSELFSFQFESPAKKSGLVGSQRVGHRPERLFPDWVVRRGKLPHEGAVPLSPGS